MKASNSNLKRVAGVLALTALTTSLSASQQLTLEWNPSTDPNVVGYKLHYRDAAGTNEIILDAGKTNAFTVTGLSEATTYSFYATSYNGAGQESVPSNFLQYTVPLAPLRPNVARDGQGRPMLRFHIEAVTGKRFALETSTNLVNWTAVLTAATGQAIDYEVTNLSLDPKRFYRAALMP
jgi:hypothetical protein